MSVPRSTRASIRASRSQLRHLRQRLRHLRLRFPGGRRRLITGACRGTPLAFLRARQEVAMTTRMLRFAAAAATVIALGGCGSSGGLGEILSGVLGGGQGGQLAGTIAGVD